MLRQSPADNREDIKWLCQHGSQCCTELSAWEWKGFSTQPICRRGPTDMVRQRWYSLPYDKKLEICYLFVQFIADSIQC